ncbi:hypothetical protein O1G21_40660 (plasmid) [Kitasatospora cathayae]|uniref:Uncharacterized protein n=1 Tax=Kitasatospora cathayae TaxID=3004092 RepID=A0ABY7QIR3_9ACTN|nr:hypothetical protein [Kitasatospora sp. HUAS 3-15]WBP92134.1 hypothetical protein O1G21_40660 [Kitasatospora sp. HUAS 3-15]
MDLLVGDGAAGAGHQLHQDLEVAADSFGVGGDECAVQVEGAHEEVAAGGAPGFVGPGGAEFLLLVVEVGPVEGQGREAGGGLAEGAVGGVEFGGGRLEVTPGGPGFAAGLLDGFVGGGLGGEGGVLVGAGPAGGGVGVGDAGGGAGLEVGGGEFRGARAVGDLVVGLVERGALLVQEGEGLGPGAFVLLLDGLAFGTALEQAAQSGAQAGFGGGRCFVPGGEDVEVFAVVVDALAGGRQLGAGGGEGFSGLGDALVDRALGGFGGEGRAAGGHRGGGGGGVAGFGGRHALVGSPDGVVEGFEAAPAAS